MKVLLVEDDKKIASFIIEGLQQVGWQVSHSANGRQGLSAVLSDDFDVIIADIMMPEMDGLAMIGQLRNSGCETPVIILSAKNTVDERVVGLQQGGDDYLVKPFAMAELEARMQILIRRGNNVEERIIRCADLEVDIRTRTVCRDNESIELQPREYALLEYLIKRQGKVVTRRMVMENVWNYSFDPQTNVVDARMCKLREKVDKGFACQLISTVRGAGYIIKAPES
jgi:two-component system, OmpR family, response regulator